VLRHRCRSRQIFGGAKDFCSNSHKLPRKLGASFFKSKDVGRHFCSYFHGVCERFQRYCPDFEEFCQEFHQIKTFGGACTPCNPVSYTSELRHAQLQSNKNIVCGCSCRYTVYHTENSHHLDQNIGVIWNKRGMLVNDNTAECNASQEKKKLSRTYLRWRYRHKRNFLGYLYTYENSACRLLKTSQESHE